MYTIIRQNLFLSKILDDFKNFLTCIKYFKFDSYDFSPIYWHSV
jgi:hypothetical protein